MTQRTNRVTCPRCGANNFETVTTCWKCSAPLNSSISASSSPPVSPAMYGYTPERTPAQLAPSAVAPEGDASAANRAAFWLAVTIPWIGLPAGWLFMMVEDQRKQRVGRICVTWSLFAILFHVIFTVVLLKAATAGLVNTLVPIMTNMAHGAQNPGGVIPAL